jgi:RNA 2',3'-cyclic 3'-phosphodiesterase
VSEAAGNRAASNRADRALPLRVFFALWPEPATRDLVAAMTRDVVRGAGGSAPRPESIHLTLAFVGDVPPERVAALETIGRDSARAIAPFTFVLDRVGAFRDSGIAWLGTNAMPVELDRLARALNEGLEAAQFHTERRPFHAHVTLARRCRKLPHESAIAPIAWRVECVALTVSELSPRGSRYRELAAWPLFAAT